MFWIKKWGNWFILREDQKDRDGRIMGDSSGEKTTVRLLPTNCWWSKQVFEVNILYRIQRSVSKRYVVDFLLQNWAKWLMRLITFSEKPTLRVLFSKIQRLKWHNSFQRWKREHRWEKMCLVSTKFWNVRQCDLRNHSGTTKSRDKSGKNSTWSKSISKIIVVKVKHKKIID